MHRTQTYGVVIAVASISWLCDEITTRSFLSWVYIGGFTLLADWLRETWW